MPELVIKNQAVSENVAIETPQLKVRSKDVLAVTSSLFELEFDKNTGWIMSFNVGNTEMLKAGDFVKPNFWRAPTDNDFGAGINNKYKSWRNPEMKLLEMNSKIENGLAVISTKYEMTALKAELFLNYEINNIGAIKITQKLKVGNVQDMPNMFRFGVNLHVSKWFDGIDYYGRGPIENYADRNNSTFVGRFKQSVDEQFYPYIRPQETGNKTDVRWWQQIDRGGKGLLVYSNELLSMSALNYSIESLDDGESKKQSHPADVEKADFVSLCIDKVQAGLGCVDSWGQITQVRYQLPYKDYEFSFVIQPIDLKSGSEPFYIK